MVIAFQVVLLFVIIVSFVGVMYNHEKVLLQDKMSGAFYASLLAFIVSVLWL